MEVEWKEGGSSQLLCGSQFVVYVCVCKCDWGASEGKEMNR